MSKENEEKEKIEIKEETCAYCVKYKKLSVKLRRIIDEARKEVNVSTAKIYDSFEDALKDLND